jgi:hypothetical protein
MFEEQIARGMAALDKYFGAEDWVYAIDPAKLKMSVCDACVVGQLIGWSGDNLSELMPQFDELRTQVWEDDDDDLCYEDREQEIIGEHGFDFTPQLSAAINRRSYQVGRTEGELSNLAWRRLEKEWLDAIKARINEGVKV